MKLIYTILICCLFVSAVGISTHEGFVVTIMDQKIEVISPAHYLNKMEVVVENKTMSKIVLKVQIAKAKVPFFFSVAPNEYQKEVFNLKKGQTITLIPVAPPLQEVNLLAGQNIYEVPSKK